MKKFIHFMNKILFDVGNLLFLIFLIFTFLSRLNSKIFLIDIFGQLSFQVLIFGILLFFILILMKKFKISIICIIVCTLLSIDIFNSCNRCNAYLENKSEDYNKIRLMTFNTGLINDFHNTYNQILVEKPDIVQFQETSQEFRTKLKSLQSLLPYNVGLNEANNHFSSIILSKYPLKKDKEINNHAVVAKFSLDETEFTIIGIHLLAPLSQPLLNQFADLYIKYNKLSNLSLPLRGSFDVTLEQMEYLKNLINYTNQNLIVMGDLNMTRASKRFTNFLKETNLYTYVSYKHPTLTWRAFLPKFSGIQIDHVLFSENLKMARKKTIDHSNSDHRLLLVDLAF